LAHARSQAFFRFDGDDVAKIDHRILTGSMVKKFTDHGKVVYSFIADTPSSPDELARLKGDETCGVYFRIFSKNIRLHVKEEAEIKISLGDWLRWVQACPGQLSCDSTASSVANQVKVLHAVVDPPGVEMHRPLLNSDGTVKLDSNGLVTWCSMRGTNRVESFWSACEKFVPPVSAASDFSTACVLTGTYYYNCSRRRDGGVEAVRAHSDHWLWQAVNERSVGLLAQRPYAYDAPPVAAPGCLPPLRELDLFSRADRRKVAVAARKRPLTLQISVPATSSAAGCAGASGLLRGAVCGSAAMLPPPPSASCAVVVAPQTQAVSQTLGQLLFPPLEPPRKWPRTDDCNCGEGNRTGPGRRYHKRRGGGLGFAATQGCNLVERAANGGKLPDGVDPTMWVGEMSKKPADWGSPNQPRC
jgi:hypothetical protein